MFRKYYFINKFETKNIDKLDKQTIIIYRNYSSKLLDEAVILKIKSYCKKKLIKFYLSYFVHRQFFWQVFRYQLNEYNQIFELQV